jgi:hypothetical protein
MRLATPEDFPRIEAIFNHPEMRAWAAEGAPEFTASRIIAPSFAVIGEEGCFLAMCIEPSRYMVHTSILPEYRGDRAVAACREALKVAFCQTDALELETLTPHPAPHVRLFARQMGFRRRFTRENLWPFKGELHSVDFMSMSILDWALVGDCNEWGEWFHGRLHGQLGVKPHPVEFAHDAIVGAAIEMVRAGRPDKGVAFYNYWARVAGYEQISITSRDPLRVNIRQCTLRVEGDQFHMEASHA